MLPFFPAFLAGMNLVLIADDAYTFLVSWEFMSLASWALVMAHHREAGNQRAGFVYIVMASFGTLALLLAFGLLAGAGGGYTFDAMRAASPSAGVAALALALALAGAGSKAGLAPLHVWLPLAHPAAPSHVSALMSGVMTKVAVYAFIRIVFDLDGPPDWRWSAPILALGAATALLGVLHALMQTDLKRVLAYSTIENIGLIFVAIGLALAFKASGLAGAAALAMTAALFHSLNHALFKSLLFFGAGAVQTATGERRMGRLGGLLNRMPATGFFMLVGCAAISALPPLNGFVSEWLMLQAILLGPQFPQWTLKLLTPAVGAAVALTAALAAACFVRAFGIPFLGRPRSDEAAKAHEVDRFSLAAMAILAFLCLAAGVFPGVVIDTLKPVALAAHRRGDAVAGEDPVAVDRPDRREPQLLQRPAGLPVHRRFGRDGRLRHPSPRLRRAAPRAGLGLRLPRVRARRRNTPPRASASRSGACSAASSSAAASSSTCRPPARRARRSITSRLRDPVWDGFYTPLGELVGAIATRLNRLQFLTIRQYLSVVFAALVALLLVLAAWP